MRNTIDMIDSSNRPTDSAASHSDLKVDIQYALDDASVEDNDCEEPPSRKALNQWATTAYLSLGYARKLTAEMTIRIVDEAEMRDLNHQYRGKNKTTNVLSFPFENEFAGVTEVVPGLLGDIVICHPIIIAEAGQQAKTAQDHYAHMVTHGILHLCGYDHQDEHEAEQMEALETQILAQSNIPNPYSVNSELN